MRTWFVLTLLLTLPLHEVLAQTPEEKGLAIAVEEERRDTGWLDQKI